MVIHNFNNLPTIDYRKLIPFQENLKDLSTENHDKLLRVLEKRGFIWPVHVWVNESNFYLIDGHQRHRVMSINELHDDGNYEVPYVAVEAADAKTAKEILLEDTSQYGTITVDGLDEFTALAELDTAELDVNFDNINLQKLFNEMSDLEDPDEPEKSKTDKVSRWTLEELVAISATFYDKTNSQLLPEFLEYLGRE